MKKLQGDIVKKNTCSPNWAAGSLQLSFANLLGHFSICISWYMRFLYELSRLSTLRQLFVVISLSNIKKRYGTFKDYLDPDRTCNNTFFFFGNKVIRYALETNIMNVWSEESFKRSLGSAP